MCGQELRAIRECAIPFMTISREKNLGSTSQFHLRRTDRKEVEGCLKIWLDFLDWDKALRIMGEPL